MTSSNNHPLTTLRRNGHGQLTLMLHTPSLEGESGTTELHVGVVPVRAFPITAPKEGLSLISSDGHELLWIDQLDELPTEPRQLIEEELALREFTPVIERITAVSTFSTPSTWWVDTNRGATTFTLKTEDDIRRLGDGRLLIASGQGMQFSVPQMAALDRPSRKLLERFL